MKFTNIVQNQAKYESLYIVVYYCFMFNEEESAVQFLY